MDSQPEQIAVALHPSLLVREASDKGQGVFSDKSLAKDEIAIVGKPVSISPERTWQTVQVDMNTHIKIDAPFEFVNHSCNPNCGIKPNQYNGYNLVAMRAIEAGEEITFDYCMTEWLCVGFKECHCNSDQCRKMIKGASFLPIEKLKEYDGYTAPYFQSFLPELGGNRPGQEPSDGLV